MGSKKESLANACFFGLLMLYYEHSRLNGLGSPFGFETFMRERPLTIA